MPDRGNIFTPMPDDQIGRLALIEAIRANTDSVQRLARHTEAQDGKLDAIKDQLADMKTSIALIQSTAAKITEHELRLVALEDERSQRKGRDGVLAAFWRSPFAAWLTALGVIGAGVMAWFKGGAGQ